MVTHGDPYSWITAQADGAEHAVTDTAQAASAADGHGVYEAVCGEKLLSASMDVGPVSRCVRCVAVLRARAAMRDVHQRMAARGPGWLSRLCPRRSGKAAGRHRARGAAAQMIKDKENVMGAGRREQPASVAANASVDAGVEIGLRLNSRGIDVVSIEFGRSEELTIDFCDVESLERLAAVAADGARQLRERIVANSAG